MARLSCNCSRPRRRDHGAARLRRRRARVYKPPAIVLRQRKLGDADKILTLYTANLGKIEAVAKGVRKTRSRLAGHVEPLTQATFMLAKGKSLDIVTQVETIESFQPV